MPELRLLWVVGLLVSPLAAGGCTSTAGNPAAGLAMAAEADLTLPDRVDVVPQPPAMARSGDKASPQRLAARGAAASTAKAAAGPGPAAAAQATQAGPQAPDGAAVAALGDAAGMSPASDVAAATATPPVERPAAFAGSGRAHGANAVLAAVARPAASAAVPGAVAMQASAPDLAAAAAVPAGRSQVELLISKYAVAYEVPVELVRRVVKRESNFLPGAYNHGHWGLMQIKHATARGMGYAGPAKGLLDAETNLRYAVKYLRGAWLVSGGNQDKAVSLYARGYYYDAKRRGLLDETGLGSDRRRRMPASI